MKPNGIFRGDLITWIKKVTDLVNELLADHATNKSVMDALVHRGNNYILSQSPELAINSNFDVKNTEQTVFVAGNVLYTLDDNVNCDTGTTKTITGKSWSAFVVDAANASTLKATWAASSYASEALALAAAKAVALVANKCRIGIVTVQAHASGFTAGTDALASGSGGNAAQATNYYNFVGFTHTDSAATLTATSPGTVNGLEITV
jgi:hypothetical protein